MIISRKKFNEKIQEAINRVETERYIHERIDRVERELGERINEIHRNLFELDNRLKECENGYEGTLHNEKALAMENERLKAELVQRPPKLIITKLPKKEGGKNEKG